MRRIMNIVRNIICDTVAICKSIIMICISIRRKQLSKKKTIDIISAPENEISNAALTLEKIYGTELQEAMDLCNERRQDHEDVIRKVIAVLKKEGLIKSHIKVELSGDNRNYHLHELCDLNDLNDKSKTYLKWEENTIHVSYGVSYDLHAFLEKYIEDTFGKFIIPYSKTLYMFIFLHEFGHYVDRTLEHEENYERMNQELEKDISNIEDCEEARLAYRKVPCEAFADKWAIDFMYKHFPEMFFEPEEFFEEELSEC